MVTQTAFMQNRIVLANKWFWTECGIPEQQFIATQTYYASNEIPEKEKVKVRTEKHNEIVREKYAEWMKLGISGEPLCPDKTASETIKIIGMMEDAKLMAQVNAQRTLRSGAFTEGQVNEMMEQEKFKITD